MRSVSFLGIYIAFVIAVFCGAVTADIGVGIVDIRPAGDLESGVTDVVADFTIDFYPIGGETMAPNERIRLVTELENPSWGITLILDGIESKRFASPIRSGDYSTVELTAWEFSYKTNDEKVRVQLTGKTPKVTASKDILVVSVDLVDASGRVLNDAKRAMKFVLNPNELQGEVSTVSSKLSALQSEIDKTAAKGINVDAADAKYDEAQAAISKASSATYADAQTYLKNADSYISDAYALLNKAAVESEMVEVQATIDAVDEWITYFQNNGYTTDPRLVPIVTKREFAAEDYADAKLAYNNNKDYNTAQEKTKSAQTRSSDALEAALEFFEELEKASSAAVAVTETEAPIEGDGTISTESKSNGSFSGIVIPVVIGIAIIVIVGLFLYLRSGGSGGSGKRRGGGGGGKGRSSKSSKHQYDELF